MPLEHTLHVCSGVLQGDTRLLVALGDSLVEQPCDPQELLLACFPDANHHGPGSDPGARARVLARSLLRCLVEMLLDTFEEGIDVLSDVLHVVLFDDLLER